MAAAHHPYLELALSRVDAPVRTWLEARYEGLAPGNFAASFAGIGRRAGVAPCQLAPAEQAELSRLQLLQPAGWPLAAVARAAWLCRLAELLEPDAFVAAVVAQFRTGDNGERGAILKSLSLLPQPERFVELAVDACRSHVQDIFEAIACENPFSARYFPEHNFNQLVLKAFFTGVRVERISDLRERVTPELVRMAQAYASERRAAGRSVPQDLDLVTGALA